MNRHELAIVARLASDDWMFLHGGEFTARRNVLDRIELLHINIGCMSLERIDTLLEFISSLEEADRNVLIAAVKERQRQVQTSATGHHLQAISSDLSEGGNLKLSSLKLVYQEALAKFAMVSDAEEGCELRAHSLCEILYSLYPVLGSAMQKVWLYGSSGRSLKPGRYTWAHHVAPIINADGKPYVLDPVFAREPIELEAWQKLMNDPRMTIHVSDWAIVWRGGTHGQGVPVERLPKEDRGLVESYKK